MPRFCPRFTTCVALIACAVSGSAALAATATGKKPNILVIFGDDVGVANISAYSGGLMGYDPFERADITSNTYWDWLMNHVPQAYQGMEEVPKFVASFKEFPPRAFPPGFNPATMMEDLLREIEAGRKLREEFPMLRKEAPAGTP